MSLPDYAIEAKGLFKTYAGNKKMAPKQALKGIDLNIPRGSIFGLLGPNGAGKSTFINILAGVVRKTEGEVKIWGRDIDHEPRNARAAIGVVPQEIAADVFFTPKESLEVAAGFYGVPKKERRTDELLAALGLTEKADAYVRQLSGGMKRRLMVAKAMVHAPPVLILDEPTAGVDVELRRQLWDYVVSLNKKGVTVVLTTHYLEEAEQLCDTIAIINHGELVACEPTRDLVGRLDTRTVVIVPQAPLAAAPPLKGFTTKLRKDGRLAIQFRAGETNVEAVLAAVRAAGVHIKDLATEDPDLEDVFLALTYGAKAASLIHLATNPAWHLVFDLAGWSAGAVLGAVLYRWRLREAVAKVATSTGPFYFAALGAGAVAGGWLAGSLNSLRGAHPALAHSIIGALAGAIVGVEIYKVVRGIRGSTGVIFTGPFALGTAIGRWGCLFAGLPDYTYGTPTSLPWAVDLGDGVGRHPVQVYESLAMTAFLIVYLLALRRRATWAMRHSFHVLCMIYAAQRFMVEFLKPYPDVVGPLNVFQLICGGLFAYGAIWYARDRGYTRAGA